jgi:hypothetical protein
MIDAGLGGKLEAERMLARAPAHDQDSHVSR